MNAIFAIRALSKLGRAQEAFSILGLRLPSHHTIYRQAGITNLTVLELDSIMCNLLPTKVNAHIFSVYAMPRRALQMMSADVCQAWPILKCVMKLFPQMEE